MKTKILLSAFLLCSVLVSYGQWTYTNLSESKEYMGSTTLGNKAYFAGGGDESNYFTTVEVYDVNTGAWDIAGNLSVARQISSGVTCGSKIFFAGGMDNSVSFPTVDIYNTSTQQWTVEQLSFPRFSIAAVSHGSMVLFAGGIQFGTAIRTNIVDIYDTQTGLWTIAYLSQAREGMAAAVVGDLAIFAGGFRGANNTATNRVDIYNFTTNTWSIDSVSLARGYASATTVGNKVVIAGGTTSWYHSSKRVDIYDASTSTWTIDSLSYPKSWMGNAATVNGKAYFAGGGKFTGSGFYEPSNIVDIYDEASNSWSVDILADSLINHSVVGVGNHLLVAGGKDQENNFVSTVEIYTDPTLIHVPADYSTIQAGINAASSGDTVLVAEGTYYENINFLGKKPLIVASEFLVDGDTNHINNTIINGSQPVNPDFGSVVTFTSGEDTTSVLYGFTITGGTGTFLAVAGNARMGGGVFISESGCKLLNNHIEYNIVSNEGWATGGGINATGPTAPHTWVILNGNRISHNKTISSNDQGTGGGIEVWFNLILENNELSYNEANGGFRGDGGGARISGNFGPLALNIRNNIITHNKAISNSANTDLVISAGLDIFLNCSGIVSGNTIDFNEIEVASGKWCYGTGVLIEAIDTTGFIFENNIINDNSFTGGYCMGGGLLIYDATGTYQNNVVQNNHATQGGGVGFGRTNTNYIPVFINNTITGNEGIYGGGLWSASDAVVINTIFWDNIATEGASIFVATHTLEVRYSDVEGNDVWPGDGNVNCHATFLEDGYHLSDTCQLVEKGIVSILINGTLYECPAYDIDGDGRPSNAYPEIGADEVLLVSIAEPEANGNLKFYPNPADRLVTISVNSGVVIRDVSIYNQFGQNVYTEIPDDNTLDISKLQPGMYIIELLTDQGNMREKLIVE